jgi:hypothetical protein
MFCKECRNFMGLDEWESKDGVCDDCFADAEAQAYQDAGESNGYPTGTIGAETR